LAEAFQYTSSRTITGTSVTTLGPQHPTYDFKMSGRGDVVLSDLRHAESSLSLPGDARVAYLISNKKGLVAESPGGLSLGLPAGVYQIERREGKSQSRTSIELNRGQTGTPTQFAAVKTQNTRLKGGEIPTELFVGINGSNGALAGQSFVPGARIGVRRPFIGDLALRLRLDYNGGTGDDVGVKYSLHRFGAALAGLYPIYDARFRVEAGLEVGYVFNAQSLENGRNYQSSEGLGAAALALSYSWNAFFVAGQFSAGARVYTLNETLTVGPKIEGALVLGLTL
jgi:hypothetical protein